MVQLETGDESRVATVGIVLEKGSVNARKIVTHGVVTTDQRNVIVDVIEIATVGRGAMNATMNVTKNIGMNVDIGTIAIMETTLLIVTIRPTDMTGTTDNIATVRNTKGQVTGSLIMKKVPASAHGSITWRLNMKDLNGRKAMKKARQFQSRVKINILENMILIRNGNVDVTTRAIAIDIGIGIGHEDMTMTTNMVTATIGTTETGLPETENGIEIRRWT